MISSIYNSFENPVPLENSPFQKRLEMAAASKGDVGCFFRADDIAVPSKNYTRMMDLFLKYKMPLNLAVVPSWLTRSRFKAMDGFVKKGGSLFCWHMHGYRHLNYETRGKKQEFGPARSGKGLAADLSRGKARLESVMGSSFTPVFTPPWNRCSLETMTSLRKIGFRAISRSHGSLPFPPDGMADFQVHVDLHTRKEATPAAGWDNLLKEFETGFAGGTCGIMIHHMRMNDPAFIFLEYLLGLFSENKDMTPMTYRDLL